MPVEYPFIRLERSYDGGPFSLKWHWRLILTPEDAQKGYGNPQGWAMTRRGALWDARRQYKKKLKADARPNTWEDVQL